MPSVIKLLGEEITLAANTANTVYDSKLVRVRCEGAHGLITVKDANAAVIGSLSMAQHSNEFIEKNPTDTIEGDVQIFCVPVAYKA